MHPLVAYIDIDHLRHNYVWLKAKHHGPLLAVVKSNAYGHDMIACAKAIADITDGFAVMYLEEALQLRAEGIHQPILLLEGVIDQTHLSPVSDHQFWLTIQSHEQVEALLSAHLFKPLVIWLKMDTGLCRGGITPTHFAKIYGQLTHHPNVERIVYMTHFSCADDINHPMTNQQITQFHHTCSMLPKNEVSIAASAGILGHPQSHQGWGRVGLALYGISPLVQTVAHDLKPVMTFSTRLFGIQTIAAGQSVGYGATYQTTRPTKVGLIACGYGDGYPRLAQSGTLVYLNANRCPIIGRPSMNLIALDITNIPSPDIGAPVELWGEHINVNSVASSACTSAYEVLCHTKPYQYIYSAKNTATPSH